MRPSLGTPTNCAFNGVKECATATLMTIRPDRGRAEIDAARLEETKAPEQA